MMEISLDTTSYSTKSETANTVVVNGIEFEEFTEPHSVWGLVRRNEDGYIMGLYSSFHFLFHAHRPHIPYRTFTSLTAEVNSVEDPKSFNLDFPFTAE
jgi:hypothetical protein